MDTYDIITSKAEQPTVAASYYSATRRALSRAPADIARAKWKTTASRGVIGAAIPLGPHTSFNVPVQVSSEGATAEDELPLSSPG